MLKYRFVNGVRTQKESLYIDKKKSNSAENVVPNRAFSVDELAYRMQQGLPLPDLVTYQVYNNNNGKPIPQPTDLIGVFNLSERLSANLKKAEDIREAQAQQQQQQQQEETQNDE